MPDYRFLIYDYGLQKSFRTTDWICVIFIGNVKCDPQTVGKWHKWMHERHVWKHVSIAKGVLKVSRFPIIIEQIWTIKIILHIINARYTWIKVSFANENIFTIILMFSKITNSKSNKSFHYVFCWVTISLLAYKFSYWQSDDSFVKALGIIQF